MIKIKNSILWILCGLNDIAYGWSLSTVLMLDFENEFIYKIITLAVVSRFGIQ